MSDTALDGADLARLFVLSHILDRSQDDMRVRTDVVPVPWLLDRWRDLVPDPDDDGQLADVLNPLVIDEHGVVVPFAYGFRSALGQMGNLPPRHSAERRHTISGATTIVADVLRSLESSSETHVDWYERLVHQSDLAHRLTIAPRRAAARST